MRGYVVDINKIAVANTNFRTVLYTGKNSQLVVMSLLKGEDIGEEVHTLDQFIRIERGIGKAVLDGVEHDIGPEFAIVIPAGTRHNIINSKESEMKLYTVYSPPEHRDGVIHETRAAAGADEADHFDGKTTE